MRVFKYHLLKLFPIIGFILFSCVTSGQNRLDGIWKSTYVTSHSLADTGIQYIRILLEIENSSIALKNFDGIFQEKEIFTNAGTIDQKKGILKLKDREYNITVKNDYLEFTLNDNPKEVIKFKKLKSFKLSSQREELRQMLSNNFIAGDFTYYDEDLNLEFNTDSSMIVTNSLKSYLAILDYWALVEFGEELFLYLSDFGPMIHITNLNENQIEFIDEYDTIYNGTFKTTESIIVATKEQLMGIWEQEKPDTTGFSRFPQKMYDKDFYLNETWEFTNEKAVMYHAFFKRNTEWETSKNGEILFLRSINDTRFRILSVDDNKLVVERRDIYGKVYQNTFIKRKSVPKPTTLRKYLK